jgi:hypothetical protein
VKENERGFCTPNCRKSYHKHGGAYRKLKVEMKKMVEKRFADIETTLAVWKEELRGEIHGELQGLGPQLVGARQALNAFNAAFPRK